MSRVSPSVCRPLEHLWIDGATGRFAAKPTRDFLGRATLQFLLCLDRVIRHMRRYERSFVPTQRVLIRQRLGLGYIEASAAQLPAVESANNGVHIDKPTA